MWLTWRFKSISQTVELKSQNYLPIFFSRACFGNPLLKSVTFLCLIPLLDLVCTHLLLTFFFPNIYYINIFFLIYIIPLHLELFFFIMELLWNYGIIGVELFHSTGGPEIPYRVLALCVDSRISCLQENPKNTLIHARMYFTKY